MPMTLDPRIVLSFTTVEWEGEDEEPIVEHGWAEPGGWRYSNESGNRPDGASVLPDQWDREDGETAVSLAARFLSDQGCYRPSSGPNFSRGIWYASDSQPKDYRTGVEEELHAHLDGFNEAEEYLIWLRVTSGR